MPYRNPEDRRANWHKNSERNKARLRESYARNREKRLAAKVSEYYRDPEKMRARNNAQYAKHREERVEYARRYREVNATEVNARAKAKYYANRDEINERRKGYRQKHYAKIYARIQKWKKQNPERELLYHAKRLLNEAVGIPIRDIPDDLAEAKVAQIKIHRLLRGRDASLAEDAKRLSGEAVAARAEGIAPNSLQSKE